MNSRVDRKKRKKAFSADLEARQRAVRFFSDNERAIADYALQAGFIFEPGDRWSLNMESGRGTFDLDFFIRQGYSVAEGMWATCHEIEHFRDWRNDPEAYVVLYTKAGRERRIGLLYHYINDILVNRELNRRFPAHRETGEYLYQAKFFPRVHYGKMPRHLQFVVGMLREKMLPFEPIILSAQVRSALEKLHNIDGQGTDLIDLVTDAGALPRERFFVIRDYIEPLYEKFFQEDLEKQKAKTRKKAERDQGAIKEEGVEGGSRSSNREFVENDMLGDEGYFSSEYDEAEGMMLTGLSTEEAREALNREMLRRREERRTPEQAAKDQFRLQYGVSAEEVEDYTEEYNKIKEQIEPLRSIFEGIIAARKDVRRRLKERTDRGVIVDPSMIAQAYIDMQSNVFNSRTQLRVRKEEFDEHKLRDFEFTLICDLSGSMNENWPGGKSYEQRLSAILIAEALDEFEKRLRAERLEGFVDLRVFTEVRGFHGEDEELKPMGDSIDFAARLRIFRRLEDCIGSSTADYKSLAQVTNMMSNEKERMIGEGELRKVLLLITDGGSDDVVMAQGIRNQLVERGVITKAIQIGRPGEEDMEKFGYVWQRDGVPCKNVSLLVPAVKRLLDDFLKDL